MARFDDLIQQVIRRLSMVDGTGVQLYSEDIIGDMIQHKFDVLFDRIFWKQFCEWELFTLDGTLGVVTANLTDKIKRFDDIGAIYPSNSNTPITVLSKTINPLTLGSGTTPIHYDAYNADASKVFKIWPKSATGDIMVYYRTKPAKFTGNVEVNFDEQVLVLGTCYDYLEDDASNPGATAKFKNLFESRRKQIEDLHQQAPISLDSVTERVQQFSFVELP